MGRGRNAVGQEGQAALILDKPLKRNWEDGNTDEMADKRIDKPME